MQKIDFFGGLHGHFLELAIDHSMFQGQLDIRKNMFDVNGACHIKNRCPEYQPKIKADHWSVKKIKFSNDDKVVRIMPCQDLMLVELTNSLLRAGNQCVDLENLEQNTKSKLESLPKSLGLLNTLIDNFGIQESYPRSVLRNNFYAMFLEPKFGYENYLNFDPATPSYHEFPFRAFFNTADFFIELSKIGDYLDRPFVPSADLYNLHQQFIEINQGWHSKIKCDRIIKCLMSKESFPIKLNIIEEAWINYVVAVTFGCMSLPILWQEDYPCDVDIIAQAAYQWREQHPEYISRPVRY
jgi:hypothetical protein